jgi:hypothetical protein
MVEIPFQPKGARFDPLPNFFKQVVLGVATFLGRMEVANQVAQDWKID